MCHHGLQHYNGRQWSKEVNMSLFLGSILNVLYAVLRMHFRLVIIKCILISITTLLQTSYYNRGISQLRRRNGLCQQGRYAESTNNLGSGSEL